jgi:hypothetical protein
MERIVLTGTEIVFVAVIKVFKPLKLVAYSNTQEEQTSASIGYPCAENSPVVHVV